MSGQHMYSLGGLDLETKGSRKQVTEESEDLDSLHDKIFSVIL